MSEAKTSQQIIAALALLATGLICVYSYWPGLNGTFLLDDFHNLEPLGFDGGVASLDDAQRFVFGNQSGTLGRPVSMASFLLNDNGWPASARSFKYTNLMLHLICGLLLFCLSRHLARMAGASDGRALYVGVICTALWLLHPLHVSTVLYVIQRMTLLSTLFICAGLICYCNGRSLLEKNPTASLLLMAATVVPFGALAILSKENGILIFAFILVIEFSLNRSRLPNSPHRILLLGSAAAPLILLVAHIVANWDGYMRNYEGRDFSLWQRTLTEPRVLLDYLRLIIAYRPWGTGLFHDDFSISTSLFTPADTFFACCLILALLAASIALRSRMPVLSFAILWFFVGHSLESTVLPLELYFEHRNYLPMFGPVFALAWYSSETITRASNRVAQSLLIIIVATAVVMFAIMLNLAAKQWSHALHMFPQWEIEHPDSLRAKRMAATYFRITGDPDTAIKLLKEAVTLRPDDFGAYVQALDTACTENRKLPFTITQLTSKPQNFSILGGTIGSLQRLKDNIISGECEGITLPDLHSLLSAIELARNTDSETTRLAKLYFLHSELYEYQRDLDGTMRMLEKTWSVQPSSSVALQITGILASAGLYDEAKEWLKRAREADMNDNIGIPSRAVAIAQMARELKQPHAKQSDNNGTRNSN